jgi:hypothetical protein
MHSFTFGTWNFSCLQVVVEAYFVADPYFEEVSLSWLV